MSSRLTTAQIQSIQARLCMGVTAIDGTDQAWDIERDDLVDIATAAEKLYAALMTRPSINDGRDAMDELYAALIRWKGPDAIPFTRTPPAKLETPDDNTLCITCGERIGKRAFFLDTAGRYHTACWPPPKPKTKETP